MVCQICCLLLIFRDKCINMRLRHLFVFAGWLMLLFASTASAQKVILGKASFYGDEFHGRMTSDGSIYHRDSLTCAHRSLPFGTLLKVRNMKNGREVIVKVNDRGPFIKGRVIDLSYAAAQEIGMVKSGVARVELKNVGHVTENDDFLLPELALADPMTGEFLTLSEWQKRDPGAKAKAEQYDAEKRRAQLLAKYKEQPRWQIFNEHPTAKVENRKERSRK